MRFYEDLEDNIESQPFDEKNKADNVEESLCKISFRSVWKIFQSLLILTLTFLIYFGLYTVLKNKTIQVQTVTFSSEGPAADMYPDYMGQYNILKDVYRYDRAVYKHVDREERFIIYTGRNTGLDESVIMSYGGICRKFLKYFDIFKGNNQLKFQL